MKSFGVLLHVIGICVLSVAVEGSRAQTSAFRFQGSLSDGASLASGTYNLRFTLYDAASAGTLVGGPVEVNTSVTNGRFAVSLDFGAGAFPGAKRWLEVGVRKPGQLAYEVLSPRQEVLSAPYALLSKQALGLSLPYSGSGTAVGTNSVFFIRNLGLATGSAVHGHSSAGTGLYGTSSTGPGVVGNSDSGLGVVGSSNSGPGVRGSSVAGPGIWGTSATGDGVEGSASDVSGSGVRGTHSDTGNFGMLGTSKEGVLGIGPIGVRGDGHSGNAIGVWGRSDGGVDATGVLAEGTGYGVRASGGKAGVSGLGEAGASFGVSGVHGPTGNYGRLGLEEYGAVAEHVATGNYGVLGYRYYGVFGVTNRDILGYAGVGGIATAFNGAGVRGANQTSGADGNLAYQNYGVYGQGGIPEGSAGSGVGVGGYSAKGPDAIGVEGISSVYGVFGAGSYAGVWGLGAVVGVYGKHPATQNEGQLGTSAHGVYGLSKATSATGIGVYGRSLGANGWGVYGYSPNEGVFGSGDYAGVRGESAKHGVLGVHTPTGSVGVLGWLSTGVVGYTPANVPDGIGVEARQYASGNYGYLATKNSGVTGIASSAAGNGVYGSSTSTSPGAGVNGTSAVGTGVLGTSTSGTGVWGTSVSGLAARFDGRTYFNGYVGIGTATPAYALDVSGVIRANNVSPSDARLKANVESLDNILGSVLKLRAVSFNWKRDSSLGEGLPEGRQLGFIAQEVERVIPELVSRDPQGIRSISYDAIVALLVQAVREQQATIGNQAVTIAALESRLASIEKQVSALKQSDDLR
jgi:hypothetical protein